jgi:hypothetical protein
MKMLELKLEWNNGVGGGGSWQIQEVRGEVEGGWGKWRVGGVGWGEDEYKKGVIMIPW